ncbi:hypothetical protein BDU57DRAFT_500624 [Ampelomyces quisqualis]|uniref:Uncharacterized protein n=1 Tax=Ampelomyces quisqualis TaxID=50730 RepID=A0A6A5QFB3_AMPQU|nr:hypothetical protein BDU57DRAFT_500624 [Ampelomyces quisqualis]
MRYDDWDVILFPRESRVPIQEFKTACYHTQDTDGHNSPTLTCYISSLPPATPFRVSIHSWATTARPSAIIESRRKPSQKTMYKVQVIVDGAKVFHNIFEVGSKWPLDIAHEKRTTAPVDLATSQRKSCLTFPSFAQDTLMQFAWDAQDPSGRINIVLSEQLVGRNSVRGELDLGAANDIVCFSFQHAPKADILEQAGISWPMRNPLYLPTAHIQTHTSPDLSQPPLMTSKAPKLSRDIHLQSPLAGTSSSMSLRPHNYDPLQRPRSHPPPLSHFRKPALGIQGNAQPDLWDDTFGSFQDNHDGVNLGPWSAQGSVPTSTGDTYLGDGVYGQAQSRSHPSWMKRPGTNYSRKSTTDDQPSRRGQERPVMVTLRDDQLGRIIQAISPPKQRDLPYSKNDRDENYSGRHIASHVYHPSRMTNTSYAGNPSAAALARKWSYPDLGAAPKSASTRRSADKLNATTVQRMPTAAMYHPSVSSNKENLPPSQARMPTVFPGANRVPTPNPFAPMISPWDSDLSLKDGSSALSEYPRDTAGLASILNEVQNKHGATQAPSKNACVKSRKEGLMHNSPHLSEVGARHDQSLLPPPAGRANTAQRPTRGYQTDSQSTPRMPSTIAPEIVEIIDVDAIDPGLDSNAPQDAQKLSPFVPNHKPGMSSLDSTGVIERKLVSALVPEYGSFETRGATDTVMQSELHQSLQDSPEDTIYNASMGTFEPAGKRKRQGDGPGESPLSKREKGGRVVDEAEEREVDTPHLGSE